MELMPNSKLVYIYMPSTANNSDGTSNIIYGTAPDIYIKITQKAILQGRKLLIFLLMKTALNGIMC